MKVKNLLKKITKDLERLEMARRQMRRDWINERKKIEEKIASEWETVKDETERNFILETIEIVLKVDAWLMKLDKRIVSIKQEIDEHMANAQDTTCLTRIN